MNRRAMRPSVESLEGRKLLYAVSGNIWPNPQHISISFMPDGTDLGGVGSNMQGHFEAQPSLHGGIWKTEILRAAMAWEARANVDIVLQADSGARQASAPNQQGDASYGDIRIGGYNMGGSGPLATTTQPQPANNTDYGGSILFNSDYTFSKYPSAGYDMFTIATHEIGHALGLYHSNLTSATMYPSYLARRADIGSDDASGIRAIYGLYPNDEYDPGNGSSLTPSDLTSRLDSTGFLDTVENLSSHGTTSGSDGDLDWYAWTVPANGWGTTKVQVQTANYSLASAAINVYDGTTYQLLASSSMAAASYGGVTSVTVPSAPGSKLLVEVLGADNNSVGNYNMRIVSQVGGVEGPQHSTLVVVPNGSPATFGGGQADTPGHHNNHRHHGHGHGRHH